MGDKMFKDFFYLICTLFIQDPLNKVVDIVAKEHLKRLMLSARVIFKKNSKNREFKKNFHFSING